MVAGTIQKGIGAAFLVNAETKAMRGLFSDLRNAGIQTIDPLDAHITLIDCAETAVPIFSDRDQLSLNRARSRAGAYLSTMPFHEMIFSPQESRLEPFGSRIGIVVREQEFLLGVRKYIGDIFEEEANVGLSNRSFLGHISVGMKARGINAAARRAHGARAPRNLHITGHSVSERVYTQVDNQPRSGLSYTNTRLRAVS